MGITLRGGKTAPRLFQDLLLYDPQKPPPTKFNILTGFPIHDAEQADPLPPPPLVGKGSCRHQWSLKRNQCSLSGERDRDNKRRVFLIATYCAVCRAHLDVRLDLGEGIDSPNPCPNEEQPLHHFIYRPETAQPRATTESLKIRRHGFLWTDTHQFGCSSWECQAVLTIRFKPPRLTNDWVDLLTDRFIIKDRAERAIAADPERFEGFAIPPPLDVLQHSKHYITNPLFNPEKSKKIQGHNKRFLLSMGEPCAAILEYFGFTREVDDWLPPQVDLAAETPFPEESVNVRIDDVEKELSVLILQASIEEKRKGRPDLAPESAIIMLKSVLGCRDYARSLRDRNVDLTKSEEHPYYAGLGAVEDFDDNLITFAYERQIEHDADNVYYYLECLQGIAEGRNSEELAVKTAVEAASDKLSRRDIRDAYRALGLDAQGTHEDDTIIGIFNSRTIDAPKQEPEMRRALRIIGQYRSSEKIQVAASQAVTNYEQALSFLGASHNIADEFIVALVTTKVRTNQHGHDKVSDKPSDEPIARRAVDLIANHRGSQLLKHYLHTGEFGEVEMDLSTAYATLDITDRDVDDELILATYRLRVKDNPLQTDNLKNAMTAIAKSRNSRRLNKFLNIDQASLEYPLSEWPVGLENIGNTCYLNSLLQFLFSIKPLRDLVLNIDDHKMPINEASLKMKRVGSRVVSRHEVARAQQFADELRKLFQRMITSANASVTPKSELARLTLVSSEMIRRQSILSPTRPSLGEIHGQPVLGPLGPPALEVPGDTQMTESQAPAEAEEATEEGNRDLEGDASSDITLVDDPDVVDPDAMSIDDKDAISQSKIFEDKENLPPTKDGRTVALSDVELVPLGATSPSRMNEQHLHSKVADQDGEAPTDLTSEGQGSSKTGRASLDEQLPPNATTPPKRQPPLPPRPKQINTTASNALKEAEEAGAQQDVTEVIANCLFQLQCAIKADSVDASGEQIDLVKDLFFGKQKSYTTNKRGETRPKEDYMSDIKVDVATGSRDIYAALDGAYDVQDVEVDGGVEPQYTSISRLPPVLQVLVQRSLYDREKKVAFKSTNHLKLEDTIYMDRYMDSDDPELLKRRRQCWQWKEEVLALEKRKAQLASSDLNMDVPEILEALQGYLRQISSLEEPDQVAYSPTLIQDLEQFAKDAREESESLESKIRDLQTNIASQFNDLREIPYRLHSVFIHRGSHTSGHYWIYVYDFRKKLWRKYDDGAVSEVKDVTEIFEQDRAGRPATPYFVVYIKDEGKESLVDPVCRMPEEVVQTPSEEKHDVVMHDYDQPIELPATEADSYQPVNGSQEYGVTDSYQNSISNGTDWDNSQRAHAYGW